MPTLAEAGVPVNLVSSGGLSVPKARRRRSVSASAAALAKVLTLPEVRAKLEAQGGMVAPAAGDEYARAFESEIGLTEKMMKVAPLEPQ